MKKILFLLLVLNIISCKSIDNSNTGNFILKNNSDEVVQFVWLSPVGEFFPTAEEILVGKSGIYELRNLKSGVYDIAIDFKDRYNTFNSKKNPAFCLKIESGVTRIWIIDENGNINLE